MYLETTQSAMRNAGWWIRWPTLETTTVTRLSSARTSHPSASKRSQRCDPRKPAPPVTTAFMSPPRKNEKLVYLAPADLTIFLAEDTIRNSGEGISLDDFDR